MAYAGIDKKRFADLLHWGTSDDELRRFFTDTRVQLILKGAKVQNLPHGNAARVRMLTHSLPTSTDPILQKWCAENLTMLDPEAVTEVVSTLQMYEELGETLPEAEAKRISRSCLVHLFAAEPLAQLMAFLKPAASIAAAELPDVKEVKSPEAELPGTEALLVPLAAAVVALTEARDPDEYLAPLPTAIATFIAGLYAVRTGRDEEVRGALEALEAYTGARNILAEHAAKVASARTSANAAPRGLQMVRSVESDDEVKFDFDRDEIIGICTNDRSENSVFVRPFALRSGGGAFVSLSRHEHRERVFHESGDVIAFVGGRDVPRQPRRGEIGIWRVAENRISDAMHRTHFHIASEKVPVYDVRTVPFASTEYDSVREYVKHQAEEMDASVLKTTLFLLRDEIIIGCPSGKDLAKDEAFEAGLPSWRTLPALRFEGRTLVPGPLPAADVYECETLAASVRKLLAGDKSSADRLTKSQFKKLQELLASGEGRLNADRVARLRAELGIIEEHAGAMPLLLDEAMRDPRISARIDTLVQEEAGRQNAKREHLRKEIEGLEEKHAAVVEAQRRVARDQRAIAPAVGKAIRTAFDKAKSDAVATLGQVAVFKALIDELIERPTGLVVAPQAQVQAQETVPAIVMRTIAGSSSAIDTLSLLGVSPKHARALDLVAGLADAVGMVLVVEGVASRIAAEAWGGSSGGECRVLECGIGVMDVSAARAALTAAPRAIAVLDANLSPVDVYGRPIIDMVQRRLSGTAVEECRCRILVSLTDSVAALPLPGALEVVSLSVSLDRVPKFIEEDSASSRLEEAASGDRGAGWLARVWKPAASHLLTRLRELPSDELALVLSVLESVQPDG